MNRPGLSKSRILAGRQCPKRLWLEHFRREEAQPSPGAALAIAAGHAAGEAARGLHPEGELIGHADDPQAALAATGAALSRGAAALFEPAFAYAGVLVRADILLRRSSGFELIEVKSSTRVKDYHLDDAAVQTWVMREAGLDLSRVAIRFIDRGFVYPGGGIYQGLFRDEEIGGRITARLEEVPDWVDRFSSVLAGDQPVVAMGSQCTAPFECPFRAYCGRGLPQTEYPLSVLPNAARLIGQLAAEGYNDLREVPRERLRNSAHLRIWDATNSGISIVALGAAERLRAHAVPRFFLDFEGIGFAVPIWPGTRPYQQLPFQWSCHVERSDGTLAHHEFLDTSGQAPMREVILRLLALLGRGGAIFVYNRSYECALLRDMAAMYPDLAGDIEAVIERIVDLLPLAREACYHPAMKGSWSLKALLPTLDRRLAYETLGEVQEGQGAQAAWFEAIRPDTPPERTATLEADLRNYCRRDTEALVRLFHALAGR